MNSLHKELGRLPYQYRAESHATDDRQVTVHGPAGPAVITHVNEVEFQIETSFGNESNRIHWASPHPRAALHRLVTLNNTYLVNRGVEIPPSVDPRKVVGVLVGLVLAGLAIGTVIVLGVRAAGSDDGGQRPSTSFTITPEGAR